LNELIKKNGRIYFKWLLDEIPISLAKYTNLNACKLILSSNTFKFRNPTEFDDPFDCNLEVTAPKNMEQIKKYLDNAKYYKPDMIRRHFKAIDIYNNIEFYNEKNKELIKQKIKNYGVHCFTPNSNNLKMWENYADNHNGVCLGFNILDDLEFFATSHNVKYVDEYPILNSFDPDDTMLIDLMTIKHRNYSYEEEVRVWKNPNKITYRFNKVALKNLAIGYKLSNNDDEIENILNIIRKQNYPEVRVYLSFYNEEKQSIMYHQINY
jgi:hypothetical protein